METIKSVMRIKLDTPNDVKEFVNNGRIPYHALKYDYYKIKNYIETLKIMNAE